jgi:hypothetical protein
MHSIAETANEFSQEQNLAGYYLTSAKSGEGMESPFAHLGILVIEDKKRQGEI